MNHFYYFQAWLSRQTKCEGDCKKHKPARLKGKRTWYNETSSVWRRCLALLWELNHFLLSQFRLSLDFFFFFLRQFAGNQLQLPKLLWVSSPWWKLFSELVKCQVFLQLRLSVTALRHRAASSSALRLLSCESVRIYKLCFIWLSRRLVSTEAILLKALNRTIYSRRSRDD